MWCGGSIDRTYRVRRTCTAVLDLVPPPGGGGRCCWVIRNDAIWGVCRWYKSEEEMKEKKQEGGADLKVRYAPQVAFEIINYLQRKVVII